MVDFKSKANVPIATLAELLTRKKQQEEENARQANQDAIKGIQGIGAGIQNYQDTQKRIALASALSQNQDVKDSGLSNAAVAEQLKGSNPLDIIKKAQDVNTVEDTIYTRDAAGNITGSVKVPRKRGAKTILGSAGRGVGGAGGTSPYQQTQRVDDQGRPLLFNKATGQFQVAPVQGGGNALPMKGDESSVNDAGLLVQQIPNIKVMFDAYRQSASPRLQATPLGSVMNPEAKQAEDSLKLAAFTFGGKNLTGQEKEIVFGALFPKATDNDAARNAKEQLLTNFMTGKINLLQAANLLGPAGAPMQKMLQAKLKNGGQSSNASLPVQTPGSSGDPEAAAAIDKINASSLQPQEKARRIAIIRSRSGAK